LLKNKIIESALKLDADLLRLLLKSKSIKKHFFKEIDGILIFDKIKFQAFVSNKAFLPDSYTAFKNKIGLVDDKGDYISTGGDVVLAWPYKDCVLEGGQTKEDQKRDEIFWNETLAPDEIDRLFAPKVITNWKQVDMKGEFLLTGSEKLEFNKLNLIIKGNNFQGLHSIVTRFRRKIKLVYIDPPFNTGDDEFKYNDKFNHSTWLTFMRNRLSVAKDLLSKNGVICVHIGNEEASYLQMLLDEIFGRENYLNHITMTTNAPSGFKATSAKIFSTANHIFLYSRYVGQAELNKIYLKKEYDAAYKYYLLNPEEDYSKWRFKTITEKLAEQEGVSIKELRKKHGDAGMSILLSKFADANRQTVFRTAAISGGALAKRKDTVQKSRENFNTVFQYPNEDVDNFYILNGEQIIFWNNLYRNVEEEIVPSETLTDVWTDIPFTGIANEGGVTLKNGKKPEKLLKRIIDMTTEKGDLVLDFFAGSGTLGAVAHKMDRQYILIEQLDYIHELPERRLKNVISGDTTGISKIVNWKGGGSFLYCELMEYNEAYMTQIQKAGTAKELKAIWKDLSQKAFINYYIDVKAINENITEFEKLPIEDQKKFLIETLDKNQLYVNYSEIKDQDYGVSVADKKLNAQFYEGK
jgi:adenine-specific DNA-methyltransferase